MSKNHVSSIKTDYSHQQGSTLARIPSGHQRQNSRLEGYLLKLETICKEHSQKIKANRPVIEQLECQRRFFKRICQKQKQKLQAINLALIREEYEAELSELRQKRAHMHSMIQGLHEEAEEKKQNYLRQQMSLSQNRQFLEGSLKELEQFNQQYGQMLLKKKETSSNQKKVIEANAKLIADKQKIEERYRMTCREIEIKENQKHHK